MSVSLALYLVLSARIDTANVITFLEYCKLFSMLFFAFPNNKHPRHLFQNGGDVSIMISNYNYSPSSSAAAMAAKPASVSPSGSSMGL